jgi:UDP-N-acetylglucosamine transferase subunit ALG13
LILVTVGTQLPFPRLIEALDDLAPQLGQPVIAQTGVYDRPLRHIEHHVSIDPQSFDKLFAQASVVVAHAGMGTVLSAKKHRKPLIIFPRRASLNEHRNDHQMATAAQLASHPGIHVAYDKAELAALLMQTDLAPASPVASEALLNLRGSLRTFIAKVR